MAANTLQAFTNDAFGTIRTIDQDGTVYFCGRDVATALGYTNTNKAIQDHCRGVPFRYPIIDALGRSQEARFITEGNLYRLIMSSKLPAAQQFEAWVVDEVLPSIRRIGMYAIDDLLANDEFLERAIVQLRAERAKRMNQILHEQGVQFRQSGRWFLYARFAEQGYTQSKTHEYDEGKTRTHMYWTQKGCLFIYDLLKNQLGLLPVIEQDGGDVR